MSSPHVERLHDRYQIRLDGSVAGFLEYSDADGVRTMPHTVVDPAFRGRGLSGPLIRQALLDAQADGVRVAPHCSAVAAYIEKHPEFKDLTE